VLISSPATVRARIEASLGERLSATLLLRERMAPQTIPTGVPALDALTGGLPRGALTEIAGPASSGRTGIMMAALAAATRRQEVCALVDASDSFDPTSAQSAGIALERLLWIRCSDQQGRVAIHPRISGRQRRDLNRVDQLLKIADLLLQSGGFGLVVLDTGDLPAKAVRRVPLTSWFRFRRAVEPTETALLLIEQEPCAQTCASLVICLERQSMYANHAVPPSSHNVGWHLISSSPPPLPALNVVSHASLLEGMCLHAEVVRSWMRKPIQSADAGFELSVKHGIR
jgi:hypothetical protein